MRTLLKRYKIKCAQLKSLHGDRTLWMDRKWMPGIFSMIDASQSDDAWGRGGRWCQVLMGHRVEEARTKESCFLRTESALSRRPLLIIGPMTGTRTRFLTRSTLRFVTKPCQLSLSVCYRKLELLRGSFNSVALPLSYLSLTIPGLGNWLDY